MHDGTARIVALATDLGNLAGYVGDRSIDGRIDAFLAEYRAWILAVREMADAREKWAERHSILVHLMTGGSTLGESMAILARFAEPVWGASTRHMLVDEGRTIALFLDEPEKPGSEGLVSSLWLLSSIMCQLEFLVGHRLDQAAGQVSGIRSIPVAAQAFLFGRPLDYGAKRAAIRISKIDAHRPLVATTAQIPAFLLNFMRLTVNASPARRTTHVIAGLLQRRLAGEPGVGCEMSDIAGMLGISVSTLRRHLEKEGTSFSAIRMRVQDSLVRTWLRETNWTVERIAEQVGYSDAFALRRAFIRINGCSPLAFRRAATTEHWPRGPFRAIPGP